MTLKALTRYAQIYQGIKGKGDFKLLVNDIEIGSISFDEESETTKKLDFSTDLNKYFTENFTLDTLKGKTFKMKVLIDNYTTNAAKDGFALSYLI